MAQIQILSGIYTSNGPDVRQSFPVNMVPVALVNGASNGYLRPGDGLVQLGTGSGATRGQINWQGVLYAVQGTSLVSLAQDGTLVVIGTVAAGGPVTFTFSFDKLAIASGGLLYLYDGSTLTHVTDVDLGVCLDVVWIDGYFMSTDGEFLVVTDLTNPFSVNPLKYGSSEASPDPVVALLRLRNEVYALNRNTIEVFDNVGGTGFPFQRIEGAQIQKGAIGTHACCVFNGEAIAFVGGGVNEAPGVYLGAAGSVQKVSTLEVDRILSEFTEVQLVDVVCEYRNADGHQLLYIHLPDRTLVFDADASREMGTEVWFALTSTLVGFSQYRARFFTWCYDRWNVGDPSSSSFGYVDTSISTHFTAAARWEFATPVTYNEGRGAIVRQLELVALPGRVALGSTPTISTSYSLDGQEWSADYTISVGSVGERRKRLVWFSNGNMRNMRIQRFTGDTAAHISVLRLDAQLDGLAW